MTTRCQLCNQPVPANEAIAYNGKHEDCALGQTQQPPGMGPQTGGMPARAKRSAVAHRKGERRD